MDTKNEISHRFIQAYEELLKCGYVADKKDFANKINISASMVTEISKGRSSVGISAIQNIVCVFDISADWLITGRGSMLCTEQKQPVSQPEVQSVLSTDESIIYKEMYKEKDLEVKDLMETIGSLKEQIRQLKREKGNSVSDATDSTHASVG